MDGDVVKADLTDKSSIHVAMRGARAVFALTIPTAWPNANSRELAQGKAIADVAVAERMQYIIFSTLLYASTMSGGKYTKVAGVDTKAEVHESVLPLRIRCAFFAPASFKQYLQRIMAPRLTGSGAYVMTRHLSPHTQSLLIDTVGDTGT